MRQHALTHKNSERPNSPNSSNTNSDNEQASQSDRNRDSEMNDQSDDEAGANTENGNEENFGSKRVDHSPTRLNNLQSIDIQLEQDTIWLAKKRLPFNQLALKYIITGNN